MSLINQMLQELDARGTNPAGAGVLQGQVRVVAERRSVHPAWWLALVLSLILIAAGTWIWLGRGSAPTPAQKAILESAELPLKLAADLSRIPMAPVPAADEREAPGAAAVMPLPANERTEPAAPQPALPAAEAAAQKPALEPGMPVKEPKAAALAADSVAASKSALPEPERRQPAIGAPQTVAAPVAPAPASSPASSPPVVARGSIPAAVPAPQPLLAKQVKEPTPQQHAENEYRRGATLAQQGRAEEAIAALEAALQLDSHHAAARQTLVALLVDARRTDEAVRRLREGLQLDPAQAGLAMILARLLVEKGELKAAIDTLQRAAPHAGERADFPAFQAALLQRDGRHKEAALQYGAALKKSPQNGLWWLGLGLSLQAENRAGEAIDAFNRAKSSGNLSPELRAFVDEKLNALQH